MKKEQQIRAATQSMLEWLGHSQELGKPPVAMECAGEFDLYEMHYYIFKYKKSMFGKWLIAVCGGYSGDELGHCGHVFSKMENYDPATAKEKSIEMVESIRAYWKRRATEFQ